ncbi:MAG TPA: hypothetical protein VF155_05880 [Candidatus Dormibacteraeota bacterium]
MPLAWHRHFVIAAGYSVVTGTGSAPWLLAVAGLLLAVAVRAAARPVRGYLVLVLLVLTLFTMLGMYGNWADNYTQAAAAARPPYYGTGFWLALLALVIMIGATAIAWWRAARG